MFQSVIPGFLLSQGNVLTASWKDGLSSPTDSPHMKLPQMGLHKISDWVSLRVSGYDNMMKKTSFFNHIELKHKSNSLFF